MKKILLYPTHRKFIQMLREHIEQGGKIIVTKSDIDAWQELCHCTQIALKRHKGIYRILLQAMQRKEVYEGDIDFGGSHIDYIENVFCRAERKNILVTIRNIILQPILHKTIHFLNKQSRSANK